MKNNRYKTYIRATLRRERLRRERRRGQALIEFALIALIFFTMLLGMIQLGLYQSTTNTLWNLSREGARYAAIKSAPNDADVIAQVKKLAPPNINTSASKMTIEVYPKGSRASGGAVEVCITYDLADKVIFPLVVKALNRTRTYPANATRTDSKTISGYNYFVSSTMRVE